MPVPAEIAGIEYTPSERRILEKLSDGNSHSLEELISCLWDDMSRKATVQVHVCSIRKKIMCSRYRICNEALHTGLAYRMTTLLVQTS